MYDCFCLPSTSFCYSLGSTKQFHPPVGIWKHPNSSPIFKNYIKVKSPSAGDDSDEFGNLLSQKKRLNLKDKNVTSHLKGFVTEEDSDVAARIEFLEFSSSGVKNLDENFPDVEGKQNPDTETSEISITKRKKARSGRQILRRSNILAKQVICVESAISLGFVTQLWIDVDSFRVLVVEVRPNLLSSSMERILLEDVMQVGDVLLVEDESVVEKEFKLGGLETLVGYNVVTPAGQKVGKVRGYSFNIESGCVESLELDSFGISILPSSLVSTYALFTEDVLEIGSDTVVVHEDAVSRIQRLTKGVWGNNERTGNNSIAEFPEFKREPTQSVSSPRRKKNNTSKKFHQKVSEAIDKWELPMDYL